MQEMVGSAGNTSIIINSGGSMNLHSSMSMSMSGGAGGVGAADGYDSPQVSRAMLATDLQHLGRDADKSALPAKLAMDCNLAVDQQAFLPAPCGIVCVWTLCHY